MQVLKDVIVQRDGEAGLVAIGHAPGVVGEQLTLDLAGGGHVVTCRVRVEESRPVILDGSVRHRIRLGILEGQRRPEVVASALGQMHEALVG
jgi:hypothetical protein